MKSRSELSILFLGCMLALVGCYDFNNPVDPEADNYQGFPTKPAGTIAIPAVHDTSINTASSTTNYGSCDVLTADHSGGSDLGDGRILLFFDLSMIPPGATIDAAELRLTKVGSSGGTPDDPVAFDIYRVTANWVEGSGSCGGTDGNAASWNQRLPATNWTISGGDYDPAVLATATVTTNQEYVWSGLGYTVSDWHQGVTDNYGLILGSAQAGGWENMFASGENANTTIHPQLVVTYSN